MVKTTPQSKDSRVFSPEGFILLALASFVELVNIILGFLDFFLLGIVLGVIWNAVTFSTIGIWTWVKTVKQLAGASRKQKILAVLKRVLLPLLANLIPGAKFFPFWLLAIWSTLTFKRTKQTQAQNPPDQSRPTLKPQTAGTRT